MRRPNARLAACRRLNLPCISHLDLEQLEGVFRDSAGLALPTQSRDRAYQHAQTITEALGGGQEAEYIARLEFAADTFARFAGELSERDLELRKLIDRIAEVGGIEPLALGREVLRAPALVQLPNAIALRVQLTLLIAFGEAAGASIWTAGTGELLKQIAGAGQADLDADVRRLVRMLLMREPGASASDRSLSGVVLDRPRGGPAAVILRGQPASSADRVLLLQASAPTLSATLARDELLNAGAGGGDRPPNSAARALSRLRLDLHDGPQQDVIMLAEDLRMFRDQLADMVKKPVSGVSRDRILGRVDDLEARLVALEGDLRRISGSLLSPFLQPESLPDAVAEIARAFAERTHIEPEVNLEGDLAQLSDSQQIALLALVREALSNIREHSDATHVTVNLSRRGDLVEASVTDDGRGFDPETALVKAARSGHLGLAGMHERIRLLGGQAKIDSRAGGPTVISVSLPAWTAARARGE